MPEDIIRGKKFGTFKGVFVPSTEAILGTVLFLLLPVLTADLGLLNMILIVFLAHTVTFATMFSIADIATNLNSVGGGGMYALIKRSMGKAMGGSIGIQLFIAQAASIGFYAIGFAEPLHSLLIPHLQGISVFTGISPEDILLQKQIMSSAIFIIFFIIVMIGADFTLKVQTLILYILGASVLAIFLSPLFSFEFEGDVLFHGLSGINLSGNREITLGIFFTAFAQFFPAVTGVDAGVGMSGDLKDPKTSLVKGTFYAVSLTFIIYMASTFVFALMNKGLLITGYTKNGDANGYLLPDILGAASGFPSNIFSMVILIGILFATSSSGLSVFMTAPRTLQSLTKDRILPSFVSFLGNDFRKEGTEPRFAILISFLIGFGVIWMGDISMAAMIVGICFLIVYGMLNGSAFLERVSGNPSFRPTSKGHWSVSFYGFALSMLIILLFSWWIGIIVLLVQYIIFRLILKYKSGGKLEGVWWGVLFTMISKGLRTLNRIVQGTKNWRPVVISVAFAGNREGLENVMFLSDIIAKYKGLVSVNIFKKEGAEDLPEDKDYEGTDMNVVEVVDPTLAVMTSVQINHFGGFGTNTVLFDYDPGIDNVRIFNKILKLKKNILLLKSGRQLDTGNELDIDIWWRGEKNGNLMVLIAYIISTTLNLTKNKESSLRILRKIGPEEDRSEAEKEMRFLLEKARLNGDVVVLDHSEEPFTKTIKEHSSEAGLIMIGLPGRFIIENDEQVFKFDRDFIDKGFADYFDLPSVLLVKSVTNFNLFED